MNIISRLIKVAHENKNIREDLKPLLKMALVDTSISDSPETPSGKGGLNPMMLEYGKKQKGRKPYKNPDTGREVSWSTAMKNPKIKPKALKDFKSWAKKQKEDTADEIGSESDKWNKGEKKTRGRKYDQGKRVKSLKEEWGEEAGKSKAKEKNVKPNIDFSKPSKHIKKAMLKMALEKPHLRSYLVPILKEAYGVSPDIVQFLKNNSNREIATKRGALLMASDLLDYMGLPVSSDNLQKVTFSLMRECSMNTCALSRKSDRDRIALTLMETLGM